MPELPEVETTRQGIIPKVINQTITSVVINQYDLRWPIPKTLKTALTGATIKQITRRGKYLLFETSSGTLLIHLGMSGRLLIQPKKHTFAKHEHVNIIIANDCALCYIDPRRFGAILWTKENPHEHKLLKHLGVEPLEREFNGTYLFNQTQKHKTTIKQLIMDSHIVTGVGNIYANEALFLAGINGRVPANSINKKRCDLLVKSIKKVLTKAIKMSGTTIRDFATSSGKPGGFQNALQVYGRTNNPCKKCHTPIQELRLGQRSTFFCPKCQM
ncbi:MAG: bifunctional DNA-formamidopyrimidine glycosylase/DNA-(apurinic or apyrimidinic site) lyase [Gammaproteobacteria bacterium]|nr:bifunctional DNA-formamidopyrimidine glycosylase/DNA-(apurinic or apyrimidinic site) lyase [Gammaproteobacteria bacterium]